MLNEVIEIIKETFSPSIEVTGDAAIKNDLELDLKNTENGLLKECSSLRRHR